MGVEEALAYGILDEVVAPRGAGAPPARIGAAADGLPPRALTAEAARPGGPGVPTMRR